MPATLDAAALCKMADRGQITGAVLDGPLAFDNAGFRLAWPPAPASRRRSPVRPTLMVPDIESGNMLAKQLEYHGRRRHGRHRAGGACPSSSPSRADSRETRSPPAWSWLVHHLSNPNEHGHASCTSWCWNCGSSIVGGSRPAAPDANQPRNGKVPASVAPSGGPPERAGSKRHRPGNAPAPQRWPPSSATRACAGWTAAHRGRRPPRGAWRRKYVAPTRVDAQCWPTGSGPAGAAASAANLRWRPSRSCWRLPELPQIACFDTAFHHRRRRSSSSPLPHALTGVACAATASTDCPTNTSPSRWPRAMATPRGLIVAHLGSGIDACARSRGWRVASTMGFRRWTA